MPYDVNSRTRRGSEVSSPGSAGGVETRNLMEMNQIEMNQIRRTSSMASSIAARNAKRAPVIREPVPALMRHDSLPLRQQTEAAEEREKEKARKEAQIRETDGDGSVSPPGTAV